MASKQNKNRSNICQFGAKCNRRETCQKEHPLRCIKCGVEEKQKLFKLVHGWCPNCFHEFECAVPGCKNKLGKNCYRRFLSNNFLTRCSDCVESRRFLNKLEKIAILQILLLKEFEAKNRVIYNELKSKLAALQESRLEKLEQLDLNCQAELNNVREKFQSSIEKTEMKAKGTITNESEDKHFFDLKRRLNDELAQIKNFYKKETIQMVNGFQAKIEPIEQKIAELDQLYEKKSYCADLYEFLAKRSDEHASDCPVLDCRRDDYQANDSDLLMVFTYQEGKKKKFTGFQCVCQKNTSNEDTAESVKLMTSNEMDSMTSQVGNFDQVL